MKKNSTTLTLLAGLFVLFLNPFSATAQIDQDQQTLGDLECNNLNPSDFETALDNFLVSQPWTDTNNNDCNGNLSYDDNFVIEDAFPHECGDQIEVTVDIECDGNVIPVTVFFDIVDFTDPFDFNTDSSLEDPTTTGEQCDLSLIHI